MSKKTLALVFALVLTAGGLQAAFAADNTPDSRNRRDCGRGEGMCGGREGRGGRHGDFGGGMGGHGMLRGINLDEAQKAKMLDVLTTNFRARMEAKMALDDAYGKLAELKANNGTPEAIIEANKAIGEARGKMEVMIQKNQNDIKAILTPEQQKTLDDMRNNPSSGQRGDGKRGDHGTRSPKMMGGPGPRMF